MQNHNDKIQYISISDLELDPENPRLPLSFRNSSQEDLAISLERGYEIFEIALSITTSGFFSNEPLIVIPSNNYGKYIVVEGNRRLAAVLGLTNQSIKDAFQDSEKWDPLIQKNSLDINSKLPVVIKSDRDSCVAIIGFRHLSGQLAWSAYLQGMFIATQIDQRKMTPETISSLTGLAKPLICDLYRNIKIVEQAKNNGIFTKTIEKDFSVLGVMMNSPKLRNFIGAKTGAHYSASEPPIPVDKIPNFTELIQYIFGTPEIDRIITDSRQIKMLANVIESPAALNELRQGRTFEEAKQKIAEPREVLTSRQIVLSRLGSAIELLSSIKQNITEHENDPEILNLLEEISREIIALKNF